LGVYWRTYYILILSRFKLLESLVYEVDVVGRGYSWASGDDDDDGPGHRSGRGFLGLDGTGVPNDGRGFQVGQRQSGDIDGWWEHRQSRQAGELLLMRKARDGM